MLPFEFSPILAPGVGGKELKQKHLTVFDHPRGFKCEFQATCLKKTVDLY